MPSRHRAAYAALLVLALIWGYNWVVMKIALAYAPPFKFAAVRAIGAVAVMFAALASRGRSFRPPTPGRVAVLSLFQTVGFVSLISLALYLGHAGKTAVLVYTMPFWVLILAVPVLGERLTGLKILAGALGFAGLVLILEPWNHPPDLVSTLLATGAGLDWAIAVVIAKKIPARDTWELVAVNAWQVCLGLVPLCLLAWLIPAPPIRWTTAFDAALVYNILLGTSLAWLLWLFILQRLPAGSSGLSSLIIPIVGVISAWAQLGERPGPWEGAGILLVIGALAVLVTAERRALRRQRERLSSARSSAS